MIDKYGVGLHLAEMEELIRYSEALLREEFWKIPTAPIGSRTQSTSIRWATARPRWRFGYRH